MNRLYETLRTYQGRPVFLPLHEERMGGTCADLGLACPNLRAAIDPILQQEFGKRVDALESSHRHDLRILCVRQDDERFEVSTKTLPWWESFLYHEVWSVSAVPYERENPGEKRWDPGKTAVREAASTREVLIVNRDGNITEGSMSNVWFVEGDHLVTPPVHGALPGIGRSLILKGAADLGINVEERLVPQNSFEKGYFDAVFVTSSIRGMVATVDGPVNPLMQRLVDWGTDYITTLINEYEG